MTEDGTAPVPGVGGRRSRGGQRVQPGGADIRRIAVHIDQSEAGDRRLKLACYLAKALSSELVGIGCLSPEPAALPYAPESSPGLSPLPLSKLPLPPSGMVGDDEFNTWQREVRATEHWFRLKTAEMQVRSFDWRVIGYGGVDEMLAYAKTSDLTILGQHPPSLLPSFPGFAPERVATASGRPMLIVPLEPFHDLIGKIVAIAWDGSREAVRAVHDGMPLLRDAARIVIVEIDRVAQDSGPELPGADALQGVLARHGFQASVESRSSGSRSIGTALEAAVAEFDADLLIAGLYHHSRLREEILGGVSHDLLRRMTIPVLVSH